MLGGGRGARAREGEEAEYEGGVEVLGIGAGGDRREQVVGVLEEDFVLGGDEGSGA